MSKSPFTPGYGRPPLIFGGRRNELDELTRVFRDHDFGENQSVLVSGLRGAGKTSMLSEMRDSALSNGWLTISEDASPGMLGRIRDSHLPGIINRLTIPQRTRLAGLGLWHFSAQFTIEDVRRPASPLLRTDLIALAQSTDNAGLLITIDEVATGRTDKAEIRSLALEISHAISEGVIIMVVYAGVKIDLDDLIRQEHLTFLRRSRRIDFRRLSPSETRRVLAETARTGGRTIAEDALDLMLSVSQGYPYLVQLLGDYAWRHDVDADEIGLEAAEAARSRGVQAIQDRVVSRVYNDLSETDRIFVGALAAIGDRAKMAEIIAGMRETVEAMGRDPSVVTPQYAQQYRARLVDSGYVESHGHGYVRFSLPYLGEYVRAMTLDAEVPDAPDDDWERFPPPPL